jgi:addiction module HigA family antidote
MPMPEKEETTHPGFVIAHVLSHLGITASKLSRDLRVPANRIYQIIAGQRSITADTALRLEQFFGVKAEDWMSLQTTYEMNLVKQQSGDEIKRTILPLEDASVLAMLMGQLIEDIQSEYTSPEI